MFSFWIKYDRKIMAAFIRTASSNSGTPFEKDKLLAKIHIRVFSQKAIKLLLRL